MLPNPQHTLLASPKRRPIFVVSTGRAGSQMVVKVMRQHPEVLALHEPVPHLTTEAYLKWAGRCEDAYVAYRLRHQRAKTIHQVTANGLVYFESSHYLSHFIPELRAMFGAKFIHLYRDGRAFVRSALGKGWYKKDTLDQQVKTLLRRNLHMETGNQWLDHRLDPPSAMKTRFEKCAWLWAEMNTLIENSLSEIEESERMAVRLEDFGIETIKKLHAFVGVELQPKMLAKMLHVANTKPNKAKHDHQRSVSDWTDKQRRLFEEVAGPVMHRLGYYDRSSSIPDAVTV